MGPLCSRLSILKKQFFWLGFFARQGFHRIPRHRICDGPPNKLFYRNLPERTMRSSLIALSWESVATRQGGNKRGSSGGGCAPPPFAVPPRLAFPVEHLSSGA